MKEILKLVHPITINGREVKEIPYDIEEITADMFIKAAGMANAKAREQGYSAITIAESDYNLHLCLGMMAVIAVDSSIDVADLQRMKGTDVNRLAQVGRNFTASNPEESSQQNSSEKQSEVIQESSIQESKK